jgi:hypothetical protein
VCVLPRGDSFPAGAFAPPFAPASSTAGGCPRSGRPQVGPSRPGVLRRLLFSEQYVSRVFVDVFLCPTVITQKVSAGFQLTANAALEPPVSGVAPFLFRFTMSSKILLCSFQDFRFQFCWMEAGCGAWVTSLLVAHLLHVRISPPAAQLASSLCSLFPFDLFVSPIHYFSGTYSAIRLTLSVLLSRSKSKALRFRFFARFPSRRALIGRVRGVDGSGIFRSVTT